MFLIHITPKEIVSLFSSLFVFIIARIWPTLYDSLSSRVDQFFLKTPLIISLQTSFQFSQVGHKWRQLLYELLDDWIRRHGLLPRCLSVLWQNSAQQKTWKRKKVLVLQIFLQKKQGHQKRGQYCLKTPWRNFDPLKYFHLDWTLIWFLCRVSYFARWKVN